MSYNKVSGNINWQAFCLPLKIEGYALMPILLSNTMLVPSPEKPIGSFTKANP